MLQAPQQGSPASHGKDPCWSRFALTDCSPWRDPTLEQGQYLRKEQERGAVMDLSQLPIPHPPEPLEEAAEELGIKE